MDTWSSRSHLALMLLVLLRSHCPVCGSMTDTGIRSQSTTSTELVYLSDPSVLLFTSDMEVMFSLRSVCWFVCIGRFSQKLVEGYR